MTEKKENFLKRAFKDMAEDARAQHQVDKTNFEAVKAESKANFEENRDTNTWKRAKENSKKSWEEAKLSPDERRAKARELQQEEIAEAQERIEKANERVAKAKAERKTK